MDGLLPIRVSLETQSIIFFKTNDGGVTWNAGAPLATSPDNETVWDFIDAKHGFAVSGSKLYLTSDGGTTWKPVKSGTDLSGSSALSFTSLKTGWVIANGLLYRTEDGGLTWKVPVK
jgi:photosystem II stability/assembly factor-like uncharacterized protein